MRYLKGNQDLVNLYYDEPSGLRWLPSRTILLARHGSFAYGLNTPTSDLDVKGIVIPPPNYLLGFAHQFEQAQSSHPCDLSIYDIRKFFKLASDCNPNIIELLWVDPVDQLLVTDLGQRVLDLREAFLSQKAKYTFSGYAIAQLKRIKTHRRWLQNPPILEPTRASFGLMEHREITNDQIGAAETLEGLGYSTEFMELLQRERAWKTAKQEWDQYQEWKKTRNQARAELERKFGYDTKHAMHLVRLMRMCREILTHGRVIVRRPDREELLAIRDGIWTYDELIGWAEKQDQEMMGLLETSPLPHHPDRELLDKACVGIVAELGLVNEG